LHIARATPPSFITFPRKEGGEKNITKQKPRAEWGGREKFADSDAFIAFFFMALVITEAEWCRLLMYLLPAYMSGGGGRPQGASGEMGADPSLSEA